MVGLRKPGEAGKYAGMTGSAVFSIRPEPSSQCDVTWAPTGSAPSGECGSALRQGSLFTDPEAKVVLARRREMTKTHCPALDRLMGKGSTTIERYPACGDLAISPPKKPRLSAARKMEAAVTATIL
jgi:hypothetical protein